MKMYLNFNGIWKSGTYTAVPAEIHDEVEIMLPKGFKEVTMADETKAIEWADGQITLVSEVFTEHKGETAVPYIVDCSGNVPKNVYLRAVKL
nr:MAG TPA: hypothetical protein [Caudoviricetes sp.]